MMNWLLAVQPFLNSPSVPVEAYKTFPQLIAPFVPALLIAAVAAGIELVAYWTQKSTRLNWWIPMALAALSVFEVIWESWSSGTTMTVLADSPDLDGLQFRLQLIAFGLVAVGFPVWMLYVGVRQTVEEYALSGFLVLLARLVAAPAAAVLLLVRVCAALAVFDGMDFRVFY